MSEALNILVVGDRADDAEHYLHALRKHWPRLLSERVEGAEDFARAIGDHDRDWDVVLCDHDLHRFDVRAALRELARRRVHAPLIVVYGKAKTKDIIEMLMDGAFDFIRKDDMERLVPSVTKALMVARAGRDQAKDRLKLQLLNQVLRMRSKANEALVRAMSEGHLLDEVCRIVVDEGGFRLAWVMLCEVTDDALSCRIAARYGQNQSKIGAYMRVEDDRLRDCLDSGRPLTCEAESPDPRGDVPNVVVLPLRHRGEGFGFLWIVGQAKIARTSVTLDHLKEMADDLAYGVMALREGQARVTAETELAKTKSLSEKFLNVTGTIIVGLDRAGTITLINRAGAELLGWSIEDLIGKNWFEVAIPQEIDADLRKYHAAAANVGWSGHHENVVKTRDGTQRLIHWHNTVIPDENGEVAATLSSGEDVTEQRAMERDLRQSQKVEALGNLAGGIAHDINNMLLPILSLTKMVADGLPPETRDHLRLQKVLEAAGRARDLCARILAFSHREELPPALTPTDVRAVVATIMDLLSSTLPKTITIARNYADDVGMVLAEKGQIGTLLMNLAVNAADAMDGHPGTLTVGLERVKVSAAKASRVAGLKAGDYVLLTVADTGTGMDETVLSRIFDPFFTTKKVGEGTGLGLSMVHGIVAKHGGAIDVASKIGVGTTFKVYLPVWRGESV